jgi:hypothetical protein
MTYEHNQDSALYVLGVLSPDERAAYEVHLAECPVCRAEVADFSGLPGLLGRLDLATAQAIAVGGEAALAGIAESEGEFGFTDPGERVDSRWARPTGARQTAPTPPQVPVAGERIPDNVLPLVIDRARTRRVAERRRRRWQTAGAALVAACVAWAAVVGVQYVNRPTEPTLVSMEEVAAAAPVVAQVAIQGFKGGTKITLKCKYIGTNAGLWTVRMVVIPKMGEAESVGSWSAGFGDELTYPAYTRYKPAEIDRIELTKADGTTLLTRHLY